MIVLQRMPRSRIIHVSTNPTLHDVVRVLLQQRGYEVGSVDSVEQFETMLAGEEPSLIIADNNFGDMPHGMDIPESELPGIKIADRAKTTWPAVPIVLLCRGWEEELEAARPHAEALLTVPFVRRDLLQAVDQLVSDRKASSSVDVKTPSLEQPIPRALRVFLCHAAEDKQIVREIYRRLAADGFRPWLDEEDLLPGVDWKLAIRRELTRTDVVVICLSSRSVTKRGYVQKEIAFALDLLSEQPEGVVFVVPLLLESCDIPERLMHLHVARVPLEEGLKRLRRTLVRRARELGIAL